MENYNNTFGETYFENIENNEYLVQIYDDI